MPEPFTKKLLNISFGLASGTFTPTGTSGITLSGLRVSAKVVGGGTMMPTMQAAVYGLPLQMMNQLSTLGMRVNVVTRNTVTLEAGDEESGMSTVFQGNITAAWFDGQAAPEVCLQIEAAGGLTAAAQKVPVTSYSGPVQASTILQNLAQQGGFTFENNGVSAVINNPYFWGALRTQIYECIQAAGCVGGIDNANTLAVWPKNGSRQGSPIIISPSTGMVGYPAFANAEVVVQVLFNSGYKWGAQATIQGSMITPANGSYVIDLLTHDLESKAPNGAWFTTLQMHLPSIGGAPVPNMAG